MEGKFVPFMEWTLPIEGEWVPLKEILLWKNDVLSLKANYAPKGEFVLLKANLCH